MNKRLLIILLSFTFFFIGFLQLRYLHYLATSGEKLRIMQTETADLLKDVERLSEDLESAGRLASISYRAKEIGLSKNNNFLSLGLETAVVFGYHEQGVN